MGRRTTVWASCLSFSLGYGAIKPDVKQSKKKRSLIPNGTDSVVSDRVAPDRFFVGAFRNETNLALKITDREVDGVSVVALDGGIVLGEESNALREKLKGLIAEGSKS